MYSIQGFEKGIQNFERQAKRGLLSPGLAVKIANKLQQQGKYLFYQDPINWKIVEGNNEINNVLKRVYLSCKEPFLKKQVREQYKEYPVLIRESLRDRGCLFEQQYKEMETFTQNLIHEGQEASLKEIKSLQREWSLLMEDLDREYQRWLPFFYGKHHLLDEFLSTVLTLTYRSHEQLMELEKCFHLSPTCKDDACMRVLTLEGLE